MLLMEIMKELNESEKTKEEKVKIIRKKRAQLLDEIHCKQQLLDQLDFMIHEINRGKDIK